MISDVPAKPDAALEMTLRPFLFSDFTGQAKVKERLEIRVVQRKIGLARRQRLSDGGKTGHDFCNASVAISARLRRTVTSSQEIEFRPESRPTPMTGASHFSAFFR
jgi:hypothetical protein